MRAAGPFSSFCFESDRCSGPGQQHRHLRNRWRRDEAPWLGRSRSELRDLGVAGDERLELEPLHDQKLIGEPWYL